MSFQAWRRVARATMALLFLVAFGGILGGVVACVVLRDPMPLAVSGASVVATFLLMIPFLLASRAHATALRGSIASRLGLSFAAGRAHGEIDGVIVSTEVVRTTGRYGGPTHVWRLSPRGGVPACDVHPVRQSARIEVQAPRVSTGDPGFDASFLVYAPTAAAACAFLDPSRRKLLLDLEAQYRASLDPTAAACQPWWLQPEGLVVSFGTEWDHDDETGAALLRNMVLWARALLAPAGPSNASG